MQRRLSLSLSPEREANRRRLTDSAVAATAVRFSKDRSIHFAYHEERERERRAGQGGEAGDPTHTCCMVGCIGRKKGRRGRGRGRRDQRTTDANGDTKKRPKGEEGGGKEGALKRRRTRMNSNLLRQKAIEWPPGGKAGGREEGGRRTVGGSI